MEEINRINNEIANNGTAFSKEMLTDQEKFYDFRAEIYDKQNEAPQRVKRREIVFNIYHDALKDLIKNKNITYLDFGCGTGTATKEFIDGLRNYSNISEGFAFDVSNEMVKIAEKILPEFTVKRGKVSNIHFQEKFNLITSFFHVLCHLSENELDVFFKRTFESLTNGGLVCFDVIKQFSVGEHGYTKQDEKENRKYIAYHSLNKDGTKIIDKNGNPIIGTDRMFTKNEIIDFSKKHGFNIVDIVEFKVENPDPKIGYLKEFAVILKK